MPYSPVCLYAATKQAFESILAFYQETAQLGAITLTLFDTYGPEDRRSKLLPLLVRMKPDDEPLEMSPGEQKIDLVYIDDVIDAYLLAASMLLRGTVSGCGEQYAVGTGVPISLRELVAVYERISGWQLPIQWG